LASNEGDLPLLNGNPVEEVRPWNRLPRDAWEAVEARVRRNVRLKDDFVQIPFPRLAANSNRAVVEATEAYKREAAIVDARLAREVTVQQKGTALSDLCDQLRAETGIALTAGRSVADEKVTVFCEQQPLRDVMRQLSRPFGYTWLRSGKSGEYRYELAQDLKSQLLEEELRNRDRNEALIALDREMKRYRKYLDLSPDEALARAKAAGPEEKKLLEKYAGGGWGLIQMWFRLSPGEMTALRAGKKLKYSQQPKEDRQPLPPDLARGILQSQRDQRLIVQEGKYRLVSARDHPDGLLLTAAPGARAMVMLRMPQSELGRFTLTGGPGSFISDDSPIPGGFELFGSAGDLAVGESPSTLDPKNAVANAPRARDPAPQVRVTVRPQPSFRPDIAPGAAVKGDLPVTASDSALLSPSRKGAGGEAAPTEAKVTSADVLEAVHRVTGLPIIADFYTRLYPVGEVTIRNQPLFEALNQLADAMRLRWKEDAPPASKGRTGGNAGSPQDRGQWLQFRSTSYFNDRLKEVPNRLLARWKASREQHGALLLDDLIEIAQLPDAQLDAASMAEGAREIWGLQEWELARYWATRPQLRCLAGFTPAQRQQAQTTAGLPFSQMTLAQQRAYLEQAGQAARITEMGNAVLRLGYTLPDRYEWREPGWRNYIPSPVQEATREAALQAARRLKPDVPEAEIIPTKLDLAVMYAPGGYTPGGQSTRQVRISRIGSDGWVP
jgi:hypothetical protein